MHLHKTSYNSSKIRFAYSLCTNALSRLSLLYSATAPTEDVKASDPRIEVTRSHLGAIRVLDETLTYASDENIISTFRGIPTHFLKHAINAFQIADSHDPANPVNPCHGDYELASRGFAQGLQYVGQTALASPRCTLEHWAHQLHLAGSDHSVSLV